MKRTKVPTTPPTKKTSNTNGFERGNGLTPQAHPQLIPNDHPAQL